MSKINTLKARITLLRNALKAIIKDGKCECGNPPYIDGNPCNICFAHQQLETDNRIANLEKEKCA